MLAASCLELDQTYVWEDDVLFMEPYASIFRKERERREAGRRRFVVDVSGCMRSCVKSACFVRNRTSFTDISLSLVEFAKKAI